jgi:hypothetical protein
MTKEENYRSETVIDTENHVNRYQNKNFEVIIFLQVFSKIYLIYYYQILFHG